MKHRIVRKSVILTGEPLQEIRFNEDQLQKEFLYPENIIGVIDSVLAAASEETLRCFHLDILCVVISNDPVPNEPIDVLIRGVYLPTSLYLHRVELETDFSILAKEHFFGHGSHYFWFTGRPGMKPLTATAEPARV